MQRLKTLAGSPIYATITTVLAVVAGLLGSVYQSEIVHAFPFALHGPWGPPSLRAIVFWTSVVLFAVLFYFRQSWDDQGREKLAEVSVTVHAMMAEVLPRGVRQSVGPEDLAQIVRSLLHALASLAALYDDAPMTDLGTAVWRKHHVV